MPLVTVAIGLMLALLVDRMKRVSFAKTLIFLPTAISFVGASLIWALRLQLARLSTTTASPARRPAC